MSTFTDQLDDFPSQYSVDSEDSKILTPTTSTIWGFDHSKKDGDGPPVPGNTYVIRCMTDGRQITLLSGQVVIAHPDSLGSPFWHCVETNGWLGFRNAASNRFLGHDGQKPGDLMCEVERHRKWEWFQVDQHRSMASGFALRAEYYDGLRPIGSRLKGGAEKLVRLQDELEHGMVWEFVEVS